MEEKHYFFNFYFYSVWICFCLINMCIIYTYPLHNLHLKQTSYFLVQYSYVYYVFFLFEIIWIFKNYHIPQKYEEILKHFYNVQIKYRFNENDSLTTLYSALFCAKNILKSSLRVLLGRFCGKFYEMILEDFGKLQGHVICSIYFEAMI